MMRVVYLGGPTAAGKSGLALELAERFDGEIVNADSQQVYRGLDVGTGKPSHADRTRVPHHLYDLASPGDQLDAATWVQEAEHAIRDITARGRLPIVVGGTGLWMRALYKGLVDAPPRDEEIRARLETEAVEKGLATLHRRLIEIDAESAARIHATDPVRIIRALEVHELTGMPLSELHRRHAQGKPRHEALHIALDWEIKALEKRIAQRVAEMFAGDLVAETRSLVVDEATREKLERVMGYRETLALLRGELDEEEAKALIVREHRRYAKRQRTWLRGESWWTWIPGEEARTRTSSLVDTFLSGRATSR